MDWDGMKEQLESVLGIPVQWEVLQNEQWEELSGTSDQSSCNKSKIYQSKLYFPVYKDLLHVHLLVMDEEALTATECKLVELVLNTYDFQCKSGESAAISEGEKKALIVRDWCNRQLELGVTRAEMPDSITSQFSMFAAKIPFLLTGDYSQSQDVSYHDLKKLLESFFDAEMILIPLLDKEWLILGSEVLLSVSNGEDKDVEEETLEESLASLCSGLQEMLANEWIGECHIAAYYPITPAKQLIETIHHLRETMQLGRTFHVGRNIHLPWQLQLEKLLSVVPDKEKMKFLETSLGPIDHILDSETLSTLEAFFLLDCNVSETAKKLYIHRNTLLYRLEKFRQETGWDVKTFHDAVLVKLALLLYKVTKRK